MEKLETIKDNFSKLNDKLGSITSLLDKMIDDYEKNPSILEDWENDEIVTDPLYVIEEDTISSSCFFITYLKPSNGYLKVTHEDIGDILNLNKCYEYLSSIFPKRQFTVKEVNKCYNILSILMERANHIEDMDSHRLDCCFDHYHLNYGVFTQSRRLTLKDIYDSVKLMIPCYNIKHQENKNWKCCSKWTLDQKRDFDYPIFSIKELISCDWAYDKFLKYWLTIPTHTQIRNVIKNDLAKKLNIDIPKDVINLIFECLKNEKL